mmetsp:Transcript_6086/g.13793  ORF Transcript_6086/g.13793 Transcript_6086/m.13793 type:complete len:231 (+) Transcript_6086:129-821(+)
MNYSAVLLLILATVNAAQTAEEQKAGLPKHLMRRRDLGDGRVQREREERKKMEALTVNINDLTRDVDEMEEEIQRNGMQQRQRDGEKTRNVHKEDDGRNGGGGGDGMGGGRGRGGNVKKGDRHQKKHRGQEKPGHKRKNKDKRVKNQGKGQESKPDRERPDRKQRDKPADKPDRRNKPDRKQRNKPTDTREQRRDPLHEVERMNSRYDAAKTGHDAPKGGKARKLVDGMV